MKRSSGILMPIFSLPSNYGIGTLGKEAYKFVDFLYEANQKYWQILPAGPISYGDSPYQSFSSFAGNPYFIDLDLLIEDKLLTKKEVSSIDWMETEEKVDYGRIYNHRFDVLFKAYKRGIEKYRNDFEHFVSEKSKWIHEYSLFMACKRHFDMKAWSQWPEDIRLHKPEACQKYRQLLKEDVEFFEFLQFLFFKQWNQLREYAHSKDIQIIGDIPIYVALDSADVWSEPQWFLLDDQNVPIEVAGCPPDAFSEDGQYWGNPIYRYDAMQRDGYGWWIRRVDGSFQLYDVVRIDHFRGFESYWAIPYGSPTAKDGQWKKGPGMSLIGVLTSWFRGKEYIAEDLGVLTDEVIQLVKDSGLPGMKVLEFAFDSREAADYLPHTYPRNSVCYIGTHDNLTCKQWFDEADKDDVQLAIDYLGLNKEEGYVWGMIRGGMSTVSDLFVCQMQDYLELGKEGRINLPSTTGENWKWRMKKGANSKKLAKKIATYTKRYGRACHE
ncbi:MAG: 4-alpha-glucanotransferase [Erysipelotrichaceae bacterium]|uniref:4-alpha-glucanotransferase n=1 Tax=Floccifex sp. TaxID=2815810 RepID=UPI002A7493B3|nr:4-alpha-glucanotransferase [Floccifex sp.]MDD7281499.1 4-alpha-glucanotransferase [Erysipelotrichaceae bacterium]MDY2958951.1 4-alpha-glucanotransferase [Floccifex sp.]